MKKATKLSKGMSKITQNADALKSTFKSKQLQSFSEFAKVQKVKDFTKFVNTKKLSKINKLANSKSIQQFSKSKKALIKQSKKLSEAAKNTRNTVKIAKDALKKKFKTKMGKMAAKRSKMVLKQKSTMAKASKKLYKLLIGKRSAKILAKIGAVLGKPKRIAKAISKKVSAKIAKQTAKIAATQAGKKVLYLIPIAGQFLALVDALSMVLDIFDAGGYDKMGTKIMYKKMKIENDKEFKQGIEAEGMELPVVLDPLSDLTKCDDEFGDTTALLPEIITLALYNDWAKYIQSDNVKKEAGKRAWDEFNSFPKEDKESLTDKMKNDYIKASIDQNIITISIEKILPELQKSQELWNGLNEYANENIIASKKEGDKMSSKEEIIFKNQLIQGAIQTDIDKYKLFAQHVDGLKYNSDEYIKKATYILSSELCQHNVAFDNKFQKILNDESNPLVKPMYDAINKAVDDGELKEEDIENQDTINKYIPLIKIDEINDIIMKEMCTDNNGELYGPNNEYCSYTKDKCNKLYSWPMVEGDTYSEYRKSTIHKRDKNDKKLKDTYEASVCQMASPQLRTVCESNNIPYDKKVGMCKIDEKYCKSKAAEWRYVDEIKEHDCVVPTEQKIIEFLFGTTITRGLKQVFDMDQYEKCPWYGRMKDKASGQCLSLVDADNAQIKRNPTNSFESMIKRGRPENIFELGSSGKIDGIKENTKLKLGSCNDKKFYQEFFYNKRLKIIQSIKDQSKALTVVGDLKHGSHIELQTYKNKPSQKFLLEDNKKIATTSEDKILNVMGGFNPLGALIASAMVANTYELSFYLEPKESDEEDKKPKLYLYVAKQEGFINKDYYNPKLNKVEGLMAEFNKGEKNQQRQGNFDEFLVASQKSQTKMLKKLPPKVAIKKKVPTEIISNKYILHLSKDNKTIFQMERSVNDGLLCRIPISSKVADCPKGYKNMGAHCASELDMGRVADCPKGYTNNGATCGRGVSVLFWDSGSLMNCPKGMTNSGVNCIGTFGRGAGYDDVFYDGWGKCARLHGGKQNCERWGARIYPKCQLLAKKKGYPNWKKYTNDACCMCSPPMIKLTDAHKHGGGCSNKNDWTSSVTGRCYKTCPSKNSKSQVVNNKGETHRNGVPFGDSGWYHNGTSCRREVSTTGMGAMTCKKGEFKSGARCYKNCPLGGKNTGFNCTLGMSAMTCPDGYFKTGARCYKEFGPRFTNMGEFGSMTKRRVIDYSSGKN